MSTKRAARGARLVISAVAVLAALAILSGCVSSSRASHLAYIAAGQNVFAYRINNRTGSSAAIIGSPFITGASPSSVVVHPSNQFLYVANQADNTISLFKIDSTSGALTEVLPRTTTGISPIAMTMDGAGSFLFVADQVSNDISVFSVSAGGSLSLASTPVSAAISASSRPSQISSSFALPVIAARNRTRKFSRVLRRPNPTLGAGGATAGGTGAGALGSGTRAAVSSRTGSGWTARASTGAPTGACGGG